MSPSPPKHRDKSMRPSTSGWSKLTSRKYVCCQMLQVYLSCSLLLYPSAVRHVTYNIVGLHKERLGASLVDSQQLHHQLSKKKYKNQIYYDCIKADLHLTIFETIVKTVRDDTCAMEKNVRRAIV